jgi:hypothetical protein
LVQPARRGRKASKDRSVLRAPSGSRGRLAFRDRPDQSDRRVRRAELVAKAQLAPPANADRQGLRDPLAHRVPLDQLGRKVTPARHPQFASSLERIAFAAETMKSWLALFARAVRPREPNARPLARQQLVYVYDGDLCIGQDFFVISLSIAHRSDSLARDALTVRYEHNQARILY